MKNFQLELEKDAKVRDVKKMAHMACNIEPEHMRLIYNSRQLKDWDTLECYKGRGRSGGSLGVVEYQARSCFQTACKLNDSLVISPWNSPSFHAFLLRRHSQFFSLEVTCPSKSSSRLVIAPCWAVWAAPVVALVVATARSRRSIPSPRRCEACRAARAYAPRACPGGRVAWR